MFYRCMNTEELIRRCKQGDKQAQAWLYETYSAKLFAVCLRITGYKQAAEDVLHDGFIIIYSSIGRLRDVSRLDAWMTRIVVNLALRYMKCQQNKVAVEAVEMADMQTDDDESECGISFEEIMELVNRLPEGYREVFRLSVLEGMSHNEIARLLGIGAHSSASQLTRAKRNLRHMLNEYRGRMLLLVILIATAVTTVMIYENNERRPLTADKTVEDKATDDNKHIGKPEERLSSSVCRPIKNTFSSVQQQSKAMPANAAGCLADTLPPPVMMYAFNAVNISKDSIKALPVTMLPANLAAAGQGTRHEEVRSDGNGWLLGLATSAGQSTGSIGARVLSLIGGTVGSNTRVDVESWEELAQYLIYDVGDNLNPEERQALLEIAVNNSGRIITRKSFEKPLQLGLNFGKRLTDRLDINFGLRLTRHTTNLITGNTDTTSIAEKQRTFFIGVPVGISYDILRRGRWTLYAGAGMAVDIPFSGNSEVRFNLDNTVIYSCSGSMKLPSWQWSVNAGAGVSYDITQHLQLFFSPKLTWYIPNSSKTKTQWNDRPLQMALPFGLRIRID